MNKSIVIAGVIALAAGGWIASGQFANGARETPPDPSVQSAEAAAARLQTVRIIRSSARPRQNKVIVSGRQNCPFLPL